MAPFEHVTVLAGEAAELLSAAPGRCVLDGTLGGGGHSEAMLRRGARVIGLDKDPRALDAARARLAPFGDRFVARRSDFRDARRVLDQLGIERVDGVLVDLGVSSPQLDEAERGFSFSRPGPLDMRMDPDSGEPLSDWLVRMGEAEICGVIWQYGEEPMARPIAKAIKRAVNEGELRDTSALARVVADAIPRARWPKAVHPATRTFQALRMAINDEPGALADWLKSLPDLVAPGGRACAISFHSLEDRPIKRRFVELSRGCVCPPDLPICACGRTAGWRLLTRRAITASDAEVAANPRARSAKLRGIERVSA